MIVRNLPYLKNSSVYFETIISKPYPVFLDSCADTIDSGRYDIIAAEPNKWVKSKNGKILISDTQDSNKIIGDSFETVRNELGPPIQINDNLPKLPFYGGAIGYFSYDLGRCLEKIPDTINDDLLIPDMEFGIYNWAIVVDHQLQKTYFVCNKDSEYIKRLIAEISTICTASQSLEKSIRNDFNLVDEPKWNTEKNKYLQQINRIKRYIYDGDCYQVNFTKRLSAHYMGPEWDLYKDLRKHNPAPFSAFIKTKDITLLSCSPEQFIELDKDKVTTKPIKGTVRRSICDKQDQINAEDLLNCTKNRAENLMIVDLLRNDLGKVCKPGSIKVNKLFNIESFENIHHLVSTITGSIKTNYTAIDVIKNCFPGGSITGAPKIRAMEIIEELESHRRGIYCGSIGYISFDGNMNTNIAIRTAVTKNNTIYYWAGGGIVADSDPAAEYDEALTKSSAFLDIINKKLK